MTSAFECIMYRTQIVHNTDDLKAKLTTQTTVIIYNTHLIVTNIY